MSTESVVTENQKKVTKRFVRKPGKTLLVKPLEDSVKTEELESLFSGADGFKDKALSQTGSYFVVYDTLENSANALKLLRSKFDNVLVKYSHYRIFFTMKGLSEESDYNEVKKNHIKFVEENTNGSVLYYKIYRGESGYIGCGDLTLDTKESMDSLLDSEGSLKEYKFDGLEGKFFRFNKKERKPNTKTQEVVVDA